jgi:hypothetical protein
MKTIGMIMSIFLALNFFPDSLKDNQLLKIVEVAEEQGIDIASWKVYIRKSVKHVATEDEVREEITKMMSEDKSYNWKSEGNEGDHHYKKIGKKINEVNGIEEQAIITIFRDGPNYRVSLAYEVTGNGWSKENWEYLKSTYKDELERDSVYYSVYGTLDYDKGNSFKAEAKSMLESFSAEKVEEMKEDQFISISAYVKDWEMKIPTKNDKVFNLQFGLRVDPEKKQVSVAIGTPIITSGY